MDIEAASALGDALFAIVEVLWNGIKTEARATKMYPPTLTAIQDRVERLCTRLFRLFELYCAGKLPPPAAVRAAAAEPRRARWPRLARNPDSALPQGFGWLRRMLPEASGWPATAVGYLVGKTNVDAFVAAVPQARRPLRSLCHMLGVRAPAVLAEPARGWGVDCREEEACEEDAGCAERGATAVERCVEPAATAEVAEASCLDEQPTCREASLSVAREGGGEVSRGVDSVWPTFGAAEAGDAKNRA